MPLALERRQLSVLDNYVLNAVEIYDAARQGSQLPPFHLRRGLTLHHPPGYDVWSDFEQVFVRRCYTQPCFYSASRTDTVIDVGAGIGAFAIHLSALAPGIRVVCVEHRGDQTELLRHNVEANRLHNVVVISQPLTRLDELMTSCGLRQIALARLIAEHVDLSNLTRESATTWGRITSLAATCRTHADLQSWAGTMRRLMMLGFRYVDVTHHDGGTPAILTARKTN